MNLTVADSWHFYMVRCTSVSLSSVLPSSYPVLGLGLGIPLTMLTDMNQAMFMLIYSGSVHDHEVSLLQGKTV